MFEDTGRGWFYAEPDKSWHVLQKEESGDILHEEVWRVRYVCGTEQATAPIAPHIVEKWRVLNLVIAVRCQIGGIQPALQAALTGTQRHSAAVLSEQLASWCSRSTIGDSDAGHHSIGNVGHGCGITAPATDDSHLGIRDIAGTAARHRCPDHKAINYLSRGEGFGRNGR